MVYKYSNVISRNRNRVMQDDITETKINVNLHFNIKLDRRNVIQIVIYW